MSTASAPEVPANDGRPGGAPAPVVMVRQTAIAADDPRQRVLKRQVPAFLVSSLFHATLAAAFFGYSWWMSADRRFTVAPVDQVVETRVEDAAPGKQNFQNEDVGLDPDKPLNYNNDRLDDVSTHGRALAEP